MKLFKQNITLVFTASIVGLIVSIVAQIFTLTAKYIYQLTIQDRVFSIFDIHIFEQKINIFPFFACLLASFLISILIKTYNIKRWHGPADTIYAAHQKAGTLDTKMGFNSTLAAFLSISGGASVGMYGPLVHFGGTLAAFLRRRPFIPNIPHDIIIGAGVAAAISAGFGSPIAGIVFAHEVVIRHFSMRALTAISLSSIISNFSADRINIVDPVLVLEPVSFDMFSAFPGLLIIGLISAVIAFIFMNSLLLSATFSNKLNIEFYKRPFIPGIMCGVVAIFFPEATGLGSETIVNLISDYQGYIFLIFLLILKILLTSLCIGFGLFGGVLSPALLIGAVTGSLVFGMPILGIESNLNAVFAVSGMAAVCSSVIGGPITAIILILELTGSYEYAIASILPISLSNLITYLIFGSSYFDKQLNLRNITMGYGREYILLDQTRIIDYSSNQFLLFDENETSKEAVKKFQEFKTTEGYFIDKNKKFIGKLKLINVINKKDKAIKFIETKPIILKPDTSILKAIKILENFVGENIPIIDKEKNISGVISENDVLKAYSEISKSISNTERN